MAELSRPFWSGSISFGLVNIPVKIYSAVTSKDVRFHLLHEDDSVRLRQKLVCPADQEEVPRTEAVKGFSLNDDQVVVVDEKELAALMPKASRTIELLDFVYLKDIDSMYFDHPYYLLPDKHAGKSYQLFLTALDKSQRVGIGTFVMRNKQYLAALRPLPPVICLETMYYQDELVAPASLPGLPTHTKVDARELDVAQQLIDKLSKHFHPEQYHDEYREAVLKLVRAKAKGKKAVAQPELPPSRPDVRSLLEALEASVKSARGNGHATRHNGHASGRRTSGADSENGNGHSHALRRDRRSRRKTT